MRWRVRLRFGVRKRWAGCGRASRPPSYLPAYHEAPRCWPRRNRGGSLRGSQEIRSSGRGTLQLVYMSYWLVMAACWLVLAACRAAAQGSATAKETGLGGHTNVGASLRTALRLGGGIVMFKFHTERRQNIFLVTKVCSACR